MIINNLKIDYMKYEYMKQIILDKPNKYKLKLYLFNLD